MSQQLVQSLLHATQHVRTNTIGRTAHKSLIGEDALRASMQEFADRATIDIIVDTMWLCTHAATFDASSYANAESGVLNRIEALDAIREEALSMSLADDICQINTFYSAHSSQLLQQYALKIEKSVDKDARVVARLETGQPMNNAGSSTLEINWNLIRGFLAPLADASTTPAGFATALSVVLAAFVLFHSNCSSRNGTSLQRFTQIKLAITAFTGAFLFAGVALNIFFIADSTHQALFPSRIADRFIESHQESMWLTSTAAYLFGNSVKTVNSIPVLATAGMVSTMCVIFWTVTLSQWSKSLNSSIDVLAYSDTMDSYQRSLLLNDAELEQIGIQLKAINNSHQILVLALVSETSDARSVQIKFDMLRQERKIMLEHRQIVEMQRTNTMVRIDGTTRDKNRADLLRAHELSPAYRLLGHALSLAARIIPGLSSAYNALPEAALQPSAMTDAPTPSRGLFGRKTTALIEYDDETEPE